ncbi:MAG: phenylalanine--tRNA ligase subunit beta [Pseudohongiellaceae bacterium]
MKFSENWLREWVNPKISTEELVAQLTMAGLEVDSVEPAANKFTGVVVGEVLSVEKHPDADKLNVCQVSSGKENFQVVCGAPNVAAGQKVPFALVGAELADDFKIKQAKLRGLESNGMLCSAEELGLAEKSDGILELPLDATVGQDFRDYLNLDDSIIDVDLTPNRGDCLSVQGIAREAAVLNKTSVSTPELDEVASTIDDVFPVELLSPVDCPRYLGRVIKNVDVSAVSPVWLKEKLRRSGIRSIDPAVDVTNYVMLELGQPLHAFDLDILSKGIRVRRANKAEKLVLLDGREVELNEETLVIADHEKALAIAGVMGGEHSGVSKNTNHLFLESAFFNPLSIAGKARNYGMHTDASHRFERGVDYELPRLAIERATRLLLDIVGGEPGPVVVTDAELPESRTVKLRASKVLGLLGLDIPAADIEDILSRLGLEVIEKDAGSWLFKVPSWRFDISIEADLIEEVARVYGYDNLPISRSTTDSRLNSSSENKLSIKQLRRRLISLGYQEVISYSFVEPELESSLSLPQSDAITLSNPISSEMSVMRRSLWPGLIQTLKHNQNRQQDRVRIFESGLVFSKTDAIQQEAMLGGLIWGNQSPEQWGEKGRPVDFYDIKGDVESLLSMTNDIAAFRFESAEHPGLQTGQSARILRGQQCIGWLGALNPQLQKTLDIPAKVYLFELAMNGLLDAALTKVTALSKYPSVRRDIALVLDTGVNYTELEQLICQQAGENLERVVLFDVYQGENIQAGKQSMAIGLIFQNPSRTLNDDEINSIINSCIKALEAQFNAELR